VVVVVLVGGGGRWGMVVVLGGSGEVVLLGGFTKSGRDERRGSSHCRDGKRQSWQRVAR